MIFRHALIYKGFAGFVNLVDNIVFSGAVEHRADHLRVQLFSGPAQHRFEKLAYIHTGRNTQRRQHDINRGAVRHEGHIILGQDFGHNTFVAVAARQFVAHHQLALGGDINFHGLVDRNGELVALSGKFHLPLVLVHGTFFHQLKEQVNSVFFRFVHAGFLDVFKRGLALRGDIGKLIVAVGLNLFKARAFFQLGEFFLAHKHAGADNFAGHAGRHTQGSVHHILGFASENDFKQSFFGRKLLFALGGDFADQNIAGLHHGGGHYHALIVQMGQRFRAHIGNIAGDFFGSELGGAGFGFKLVQVDGGEHILFHQLFGNQNGVFVVITFPAQETDQQVAAQRQLALPRGGTISKHIAGLHAVAAFYKRNLSDAGVLIGAFVLNKGIHVHFRAGLFVRLHGDKIAGCENDFSASAGNAARAGIGGARAFHAGAYQREFGQQKRHGLTLHVAAHQGAVGVVVFKERNQRG